MIRIWGRANSVNVQKVLWCCDELGLVYERLDAGMQFGRVNDPDYRALNPNGRVPTLVDGDFVLWESNAILRYLAMKYGGSLYPEGPEARSSVDRWLDWQLSTVQPAERPLFWGLVRTPPERRDAAAIREAATMCGAIWALLDARLADGDRRFIEGDAFTLADIALGAFVRRWFGVAVADRPNLPHLQAWYQRLHDRPGFGRHVAVPLT